MLPPVTVWLKSGHNEGNAIMERRAFLKILCGVAGAAAATTLLGSHAAEAAMLQADSGVEPSESALETVDAGTQDEIPQTEEAQYYYRRRYYRPRRRVYYYRRPRRYYVYRRPRRRVFVRRVYFY